MKRFNESTNDYVFTLYFTNNSNNFVAKLDKRNYDDISSIQDEIIEQSKASGGSDDVWVEEVHLEKAISKADTSIDWTSLIKDLDEDIIKLIFEEDDIGLKIMFLKDHFGSRLSIDDITDNIDDITVEELDNDRVYDSDNQAYPQSFVDDYFETRYPVLKKELEKANAEGHFDTVNLVRDAGYNGEFSYMTIGDYFLYSYEII